MGVVPQVCHEAAPKQMLVVSPADRGLSAHPRRRQCTSRAASSIPIERPPKIHNLCRALPSVGNPLPPLHRFKIAILVLAILPG